MSRYIDAEKLKDLYQPIDGKDYKVSVDILRLNIDDIPTADVEEVSHEKWEKQYTDGFCNGKRNYKMICPRCNFSYLDNHCGMIVPEHFNYCPNCGAKMRRE